MMNKDNFVFNGDWSFEIVLHAFAGFQERRGPYTAKSSELPANGLVIIEFEDDLTDNPDPYVEQLNTLDFIFNNHEKIAHALIEKTVQYTNHGIEEEHQHIKYHTVKSVMGVAAITIQTVSKDGVSYYDIACGSDLEEENGLNFLFHKERIVSLKPNTGIPRWDALKDNGTYEQFANKPREGKIIQRYTPHPKYNKLKPSQQFANDTYEHSLIARKLNDRFINEVENGTIDINGIYKGPDWSYLELTYWFNNNELSEYLLSKKAHIRYALHMCVDYAYSEEALAMLLKHGADINAYDHNGKTVIYKLVASLLYWIDEHYRLNYHTHFEQPADTPENFKQKIAHFIRSGADPNIRNLNGQNCFDVMKNASADIQIQVSNFLQDCLKQK
ncbi:hypothetical protein [Niastella sp. OAS944]|uniref:DUF6985 domain-containing protein n=1 Tax=Niastella sp. OAS944 TaxID=2664089 RepID=UPI00349AB06E|nr:hypothetical protein [Chitinophagaceae bacterium OAS944]